MTDLESKAYFKVFCCVTWIDLGLKGKDPWSHQVIEFYPNLTPWETKQHFKRFLFRTLTPVPAHEMLTWQLVTLHVALWVLLDLEMESMWHQNKAANLFCKQRDVFIFPLTPGALAAPQLGYTILTWQSRPQKPVQPSGTAENSGSLSRVRKLYKHRADPWPANWFNQIQWHSWLKACQGE